jgi:hypothetical protein
MIGAAKAIRISSLLGANCAPSMSAAVQERRNLTVTRARNDHWSPTNRDRFEIIWLGYLGLMQKEDPRATKNSAHLPIENLLVSEESSVKETIRSDQIVITRFPGDVPGSLYLQHAALP